MRVPIRFISDGGWGALSEQEIADIILEPKMKEDFIIELEALIEQAHEAGVTYACWADGYPVTNDDYEQSKEDLELAVKQFIEKYK